MTHDLALRLLAPLGARLTRVVVNAITDGTFFAEISVEAAGQTHVVDARPSDAIALAVRSGAPIFVSRQVYDTCGVENDERDALGFSIRNVEPKPSPFDPPTLWYLGKLARAANFELDVAHSFDWQAREVELDGATYTSITLPGDTRRRLLIEPQAWALLQGRMTIMTEERRKLEELMASRTATQATEEAPRE
jgi:hypothetical protein